MSYIFSKKILLLFFIFHFLLPVTLKAQQPVIITDTQDIYHIGPYVEILEDKEGSFTIDQVVTLKLKNKFSPNQKRIPNFGFTKSTYWINFSVSNQSRRQSPVILEVGYPNFHYVDYYLFSQDGQLIQSKKTGNLRKLKNRDYIFPKIVFLMMLPPKSSEFTVYMRFQNQAAMILPLKIYSITSFMTYSQTEYLIYGLFFGILLIMAGYSLYLFYSLNDNSYLFFGLCIISIILFALAYTGIGFIHLWPGAEAFNYYAVPIANILVLLVFLKFTSVFLQLKYQLPLLNRIFNGLFIITGILLILVAFIDYHYLIIPIVYLSSASFIIMLLSGIFFWYQGYTPARSYVFSLTIFLLVGIISSVTKLGFFSGNLFNDTIYLFGIILFVLFLSKALGDRINLLKSEITTAYQKLNKTEQKYYQIFENIQDVYFESSLEGKILEISPSINQISKYKRTELIGKEISDFYAESGQRKQFINKITSQGIISDFEFSLKDKDNSIHNVSTNAKILKDSNGNPLKIVGSLRDITEKKSLEKQLLQAQKMDAIGHLAGGIAHDFNNLLIVIIGYSEMLLEKKYTKALLDDLKQIHDAGIKAKRLVAQLLAFSRKQVMQPEVLNLNDLITDYNVMLKRLLGENIEIITVFQSDLGMINIDPGQVEQIIMNITVNARDAMPFGGTITIETKNVQLDKEFINNYPERLPGAYVMVAISDTGIGMDEETCNHIFEPFFTTKGRDKGTGLGLSTVYGIVKQNNGCINVYSELHKGTTFKIYFPRIGEKEKKETISSDNLSNLQGSETILLVEDESSVRELTRKILIKFGYNILSADNGKEALEVYQNHKGSIDLLLTDVIMPVMSGRELTNKLLKQQPELKVLYFSGYTDNSIVHHGVLEPGVEFIQKPFSHIELARKIRKVLEKN